MRLQWLPQPSLRLHTRPGHAPPTLSADGTFCLAAEEGWPQMPGFGSSGPFKVIQARSF